MRRGGIDYHLQEQLADPLADSTDLLVNGIERISRDSRRSGGLESIRFGALTSLDRTSIPEPTSLWLVAGGAVVTGWRHRRRQGRTSTAD